MGLFDIFGTGDQEKAAASQTAGVNTGLTDLSKYFSQGRDALQTNYAAGLQPFQQNYTTAQQGTTALGDALGLNGQSGNDAAIAAFKNNPGYQFQLQQGEDAIKANQAATGQLASGKTNLDLLKFGQGLAGTGWNNYVSQLQPYLGASNSAASGIGALDSGLGNQLNTNLTTQGNAYYGGDTSIGNANANANLAGLNASANSLGALTGLGTSLMGFLSDERAKEDIEPIGKLYDGQDIYRYRYKGDPRHQIGMIAQEVEEREPAAVFNMGDYKGVDYKRATDYAANLMKFAA